MFCMKCGKEIPANSDFCPECGTRSGTLTFSSANAEPTNSHEDMPQSQNAQTDTPQQSTPPQQHQDPQNEEQGSYYADAHNQEPQKQSPHPEANTVEQQFQQFSAYAAYLSAVKSAYFAYKLQYFFIAVIFSFITINFARQEWLNVGIGVVAICVICYLLDARQKKILGSERAQTEEEFDKSKEQLYQMHFHAKSKEIAIWIVETILFIPMLFIVYPLFEDFWNSLLFCLFVVSVISSFIRLCWLFKWAGAIICGIFVILLITHPLIVLATIVALFSAV